MATRTTTKSDQARAQREAKARVAASVEHAASVETGPALPGGELVAVAGKPATKEQKADAKKAVTLTAAEKAEAKAKRDNVDVVEVESIPTSSRKSGGGSGPSKWAERLSKVVATKTGKARIYEAPTPQTAHGTRYRLNKRLAAGELDADLKHFGVEGATFTLTVCGSDIYAEISNPA